MASKWLFAQQNYDIFSSDDLVSFGPIERPFGTFSYFSSSPIAPCAYGNGLWVIASNQATNVGQPSIATSPDRVTWTGRSIPLFDGASPGPPYQGIAAQVIWAGSQFVAVGGDGNGYGVIVTSPDGVTWTRRTTPYDSTYIFGYGAVAAWGGVVVALGYPDHIVYSLDGGSTWAACTVNGPVPFYTRAYSQLVGGTISWGPAIAAGPKGFVIAVPDMDIAGKANIAHSSDGITFTTQDPAATGHIPLNFGTSSGGGSVIPQNKVVWDGAVFYVGTGSSSVHSYSSTDGLTWVTAASVKFLAVAPGEGLLVGVGWNSPNNLWTSTDHGQSFTAHGNVLTEGTLVGVGSDFVPSIALATPTVWLAVEDSGINVAVSSDLNSWDTSSPFGAGSYPGAAAWSPSLGLWVIVDNRVFDSPILASSPDGITWTGRPSGLDGEVGSDILWTGTQFIVVGQSATGLIYTSPDGVTWTQRVTPLDTSSGQAPLNAIAMNGSHVVAVGPGTILYSTDGGNTWAQGTLDGSLSAAFTHIGDVTYGNGVWVLSNESITQGAIATSSDGVAFTSQVAMHTVGVGNRGNGINGGLTFDGKQFLAAPFTGTGIWISPDGVTWTHQSVSFTPYDLVAGSTEVAAVGPSPYIVSSPNKDGVSWTSRGNPFSSAVGQISASTGPITAAPMPVVGSIRMP